MLKFVFCTQSKWLVNRDEIFTANEVWAMVLAGLDDEDELSDNLDEGQFAYDDAATGRDVVIYKEDDEFDCSTQSMSDHSHSDQDIDADDSDSDDNLSKQAAGVRRCARA